MGSTVEAIVADDGMIHIPIPNAQPGDHLQVKFQNVSHAQRNYDKRIGWLKGVIEIHPSFDDPIEGLP